MADTITPQQAFEHFNALDPTITHISLDKHGLEVHHGNKRGHGINFNVTIDWNGTNRYPPLPESELTDEDAKRRPLVMVRYNDTCEWRGPAKLLGLTSKYYVVTDGSPIATQWDQCRLATPEEAAKWDGDKPHG